MSDFIDHTLKLWRSTPFDWGQRDCMLSIGDYIAACGGLDVTARFRGTYDDEAGALALVEAHGGIAGLIDLTGLERTLTPARGDVVALDTGAGHVGALHTGLGVAARLLRGVIEVDARLVKIPFAWKIAK